MSRSVGHTLTIAWRIAVNKRRKPWSIRELWNQCDPPRGTAVLQLSDAALPSIPIHLNEDWQKRRCRQDAPRSPASTHDEIPRKIGATGISDQLSHVKIRCFLQATDGGPSTT